MNTSRHIKTKTGDYMYFYLRCSWVPSWYLIHRAQCTKHNAFRQSRKPFSNVTKIYIEHSTNELSNYWQCNAKPITVLKLHVKWIHLYIYINLIISCCWTFLATETNGASARSMLVHKTTDSTVQTKGPIMSILP